jgi:hypothetical protein
MEQETKRQLLEQALDALCKVAGRNITVFLPEDKAEQIPYLKREIIKTTEAIKNG